MVTNFPTHYPLSHGRMTSFQPPWGMRTVAKFSGAFSGHPNTSCTSEAIPAFGKSSARLIASEWALTSVSHTTVNVVQKLVAATLVRRLKEIKNDYSLQYFSLMVKRIHGDCTDINVDPSLYDVDFVSKINKRKKYFLKGLYHNDFHNFWFITLNQMIGEWNS